jgi:hypothetical protein
MRPPLAEETGAQPRMPALSQTQEREAATAVLVIAFVGMRQTAIALRVH